MYFEFSPYSPDESKWRVDPTIVDALIEAKAIDAHRRSSAPMKRIEFGTNIVFKEVTGARSPYMIHHVKELTRD